MAFISEIDYAGSGEGGGDEFVEVTLLPGEDPADFTLSFYDASGLVRDDTSSFFSSGEITLQDVVNAVGGVPGSLPSTVGGVDLQVQIHPDNPNALVFTIPASLSQNTTIGNAEAVALTNTSTNTVIDAYDFAANGNAGNFINGAAAGADPENTVLAGGGNAVQIDINGNQSSGLQTFGDSVICFHQDTQIQTIKGPVAVCDLSPGDLLVTADGHVVPLRFSVRRKVSIEDLKSNQKTWPIKISAGALGSGLPKRDLKISRQHRILVDSKISRRMFGEDAVLVAAHFLVGLPGISTVQMEKAFSYYHLITDKHQILVAEGAPAESLFPGVEAHRTLPQSLKDQVALTIPAFLEPQDHDVAARFIPSATKQKRLIERHICNKQDVLLCYEGGLGPIGSRTATSA